MLKRGLTLYTKQVSNVLYRCLTLTPCEKFVPELRNPRRTTKLNRAIPMPYMCAQRLENCIQVWRYLPSQLPELIGRCVYATPASPRLLRFPLYRKSFGSTSVCMSLSPSPYLFAPSAWDSILPQYIPSGQPQPKNEDARF